MTGWVGALGGMSALALGTWLIRVIARRRVYVFGQCSVDEGRPRTTFRFAVQSAESRAINAPIRATVVVGSRTKIIKAPRVFSGPLSLEHVWRPEGFQVTFPKLRPYDTLVIECDTNRSVTQATVHVESVGEKRFKSVPLISLTASHGTARGWKGRPVAPLMPIFLGSIVLGVLVYWLALDWWGLLLPKSGGSLDWRQWSGWGVALGVALVSSMFVFLAQRNRPEAILGFWEAKELSWPAHDPVEWRGGAPD